MIKDLDLTPDQNRSLEYAISDHTGHDVEVTHVQDEGDVYKTFFSYEHPKTGKEVQQSMYFTMSVRRDKIEDFEEKTFTKESKLSEGTWAFPASILATKKLGQLLAKPLSAEAASKELYSILGDDDLFDDLDDAAEEGVKDARPIIKRRLKKMLSARSSIDPDVKAALKKLVEGQLDEKVHTLKNPNIKPRGAPEVKARTFDRKPMNRSALKALEKAKKEKEEGYIALDVSEDPDYTMVLVHKLGAGTERADYYGVNVLFYPDGRIDASTADSLADKQWAKDKQKITDVAKKRLKITESKISFKQFLLREDAGDRSWYKTKKQWQAAVNRLDIDDDGQDWAKMDGKLVAKWIEGRQEGWVDPDGWNGTSGAVKEGRGKFGVKMGGVYTEHPEVGFEDRLNFEHAKVACKNAGIEFKTTSNFGIKYMIFNSEADQKKAVRLIKRVIDKSAESEW